MEFRKKEWKQETLTLVDSRRQKWSYISAKDMQQQYPNGGYLILVDLKAGKKEDAVGYLTQDDKKIEVFPYKAKLKAGETCVGFLQVESNVHKDAFVRVVKRKKIPPLCYLLLLVLLLVGIGTWYLSSRPKGPDLDQNAISYHVEGLENKDPSNISIPLFAQLRVDAGTMKVQNHLANPEGNPCYFEYHILLKDGNEELYQSGLLEPGTAIPEFTLNRKLEVGSYPAEIQIKTYRLKDHTVAMNGGDIDITLVVEEEQ